jgi:hypothetical protein
MADKIHVAWCVYISAEIHNICELVCLCVCVCIYVCTGKEY